MPINVIGADNMTKLNTSDHWPSSCSPSKRQKTVVRRKPTPRCAMASPIMKTTPELSESVSIPVASGRLLLAASSSCVSGDGDSSDAVLMVSSKGIVLGGQSSSGSDVLTTANFIQRNDDVPRYPGSRMTYESVRQCCGYGEKNITSTTTNSPNNAAQTAIPSLYLRLVQSDCICG